MSNENLPDHEATQDSPAIEGMLREMNRGGEGNDEKFVKRVMAGVENRGRIHPLEPRWSWLGGRRFWLATAAVVTLSLFLVGMYSAMVLTRHAAPQEVMLYSQSDLAPGHNAAFRVFVRDGRTQKPMANAAVAVVLRPANGKKIRIAAVKTDEHGIAVCETRLPEDLPEGNCVVEAEAETGGGDVSVSTTIAIKRSFKCMLSTDKPMYQPGQTIHIRTLSLATADLKPVAGRQVVIEVQDAKGNKVFKKMQKTSDFGIAAADFVLADQVNMGSYTLTATIGDSITEKTVDVKRYTLPKYSVELTTDRGFYKPGETVKGTLKATYTFGKPVANAAITIDGQEFVDRFRTFASISGKTDADGNFPFELKLKSFFAGSELKKGDAYVSLKATVIDPAKHKLEKTRELTVTTKPIRIDVIPESGDLVAAVENRIYFLTTTPDGRPLQTELTIAGAGEKKQVTTSDLGLAIVPLTPTNQGLRLQIQARTKTGAAARVTRNLPVGTQQEAFLLRTDKAVYRTGETVKLEVVSAARTARVFVDVVKNRRTQLMTTIDVSDGKGTAAIDLNPELFGTMTLHAYRILPSGEMIRDDKVIQVNRAGDLTITAELDKDTYRPGEKAIVNFLIKNRAGDPTQAALSLAAVDEAVFALSELRPGFERVYFALQEELLEPRFEIHGHLPPAVYVHDDPRPDDPEAAQQEDLRKGALLAAADGGDGPARHIGEMFNERNARIAQEQEDYRETLAAYGFMAPFGIFVLSLLPLFGYTVYKLFRPQSVTAASTEELQRFRRDLFWLILVWILGFYAALLCSFLGAGAGALFREMMHASRDVIGFFAAIGIGIGAIGIAVVEFFLARRLRRREIIDQLPVWRKLTYLLPFSYLLAGIAFIAMIIGAVNRVIEEPHAIVVVAGLPLLLGLAAGALSVAARITVSHMSGAGILWAFCSRSAAVLLIPVLFFTWMVVQLNKHNFQRQGADLAMAKRKFAGAAEAMPMMPPEEAEMSADFNSDEDTPDAGAAGQALKAPTRVRRYFPETLLWKPELITDAQGKAQLHLPLADSITTWRLAMSAVSKRGELASDTKGIRVFQDFFIDIDFPVELTQHDRVSVPVSLFNYLKTDQTVRLEVQPADWCKLLDDPKKTLVLKPGEIKAVYFTIIAEKPGRHALQIKAFGSEMADAVERRVNVKPDGEEFVQTVNGELKENLNREIVIPAAAIDGASDLYVKIYPGAFSQVMEGLDGIFRMPNGCFEQTSSATYPNVIVLNYMRQTKQIKPELEMKALQYINTGYQRLLSFEVKGGGFEWFGNPPAHNILTAYGLLEFHDMAKVYEVDPKVISRTREWLFAQQQGDGSWTPTSGGIPEGAINRQGSILTATAYIAWALAESGQRDARLDKALNWLAGKRSEMKDNYTFALTCNAFVHADRAEAKDLLKELVQRKSEKDKLVWWDSTGQGATYSKGNVLAIETTGLAACALLNGRYDTSTAHKSLAWLIQQKDSFGTWSSTQATIFGIKALLAGSGTGGAATDKDLNVTVTANGKLAEEIRITPETSDVYRLISLRELVKEGTNKIALETSGAGNLAYQIVARHYIPWPTHVDPQPRQEVLAIDVNYDTDKIAVDDKLTCNVSLQYNRPGTAQMTIVDLGIPPGFKVETDAFSELKASGVIEKYSVTGRQVILYFREIRGREPLLFSYQLKAKFPVKAKTPVAAAYQYYEPEIRAEAKPVVLEVR